MTNPAQETTRSICSRNSRLRIFFRLRLSPGRLVSWPVFSQAGLTPFTPTKELYRVSLIKPTDGVKNAKEGYCLIQFEAATKEFVVRRHQIKILKINERKTEVYLATNYQSTLRPVEKLLMKSLKAKV